MRIVELDEKSSRIKNKKLTLDIEYIDMPVIDELISSEIKIIREKIRNEEQEIKQLYNKDDFEMLSHLNNLHELVNESMLRNSQFEITYEQMDVLWKVVLAAEDTYRKQLSIYGKTLMPDLNKKCTLLKKIIENNYEFYKNVMAKLYHKRTKLIDEIKDYEKESMYNGCLVNSEGNVTIHVPMREKDEMLQKIDFIMNSIEQCGLKSIIAGSEEMPIEIMSDEIALVCDEVVKELTKNIYSGSVFSLSFKSYYILNTINSQEI